MSTDHVEPLSTSRSVASAHPSIHATTHPSIHPSRTHTFGVRHVRTLIYLSVPYVTRNVHPMVYILYGSMVHGRLSFTSRGRQDVNESVYFLVHTSILTRTHSLTSTQQSRIIISSAEILPASSSQAAPGIVLVLRTRLRIPEDMRDTDLSLSTLLDSTNCRPNKFILSPCTSLSR